MLEAVTSGLTTVLAWIGAVISALVTTDGELSALMPLLAIGISISVVFLGVKAIKSLVWGT